MSGGGFFAAPAARLQRRGVPVHHAHKRPLMADLIAQGSSPQQRWRRSLRQGETFVLGRDAGEWTVPWDEHISRRHAEICWQQGRLSITRLASARNPIFVAGKDSDRFEIKPGEHFVIGNTTFTLTDDRVHFSVDVPHPVEEQTYSAQYLERVRFRNADYRIEVLARLPDVISGAVNDSELFVRLVNMLLAGMPHAEAVALVVLDETTGAAKVAVLHWDRRFQTQGDFEPSQRLVVEAVHRRQSVLHVWGPNRSATGSGFTMMENVDWAFCTPVLGESCAGWGIYVAGRFSGPASGAHTPSDRSELREDVKFTELVAATLSALRHVKALERKQSALGHFFAPAVMRAMQSADAETVLAPRETVVSVLFCDLRGFSREAERNADDLLGLLNRVSKALGVTTHHILDQGGVLGDFHGDAAMGFWGWPLPQHDAVSRACGAALAIRQEFEAAARRPGHSLADFRMGIGMATGKAVAGRIGTIDQVKVTVFGPVVNLASRLEGMTKILRAPILLDDVTAGAVRLQVPPALARVRRVARVVPYGMTTPVEVSELLPPQSEFPDFSDEHLRAYEAALDAFHEGRWNDALELLHQVTPKDRVKDFLMVFIAQHNRTAPPGFDGTIPLVSKS